MLERCSKRRIRASAASISPGDADGRAYRGGAGVAAAIWRCTPHLITDHLSTECCRGGGGVPREVGRTVASAALSRVHRAVAADVGSTHEEYFRAELAGFDQPSNSIRHYGDSWAMARRRQNAADRFRLTWRTHQEAARRERCRPRCCSTGRGRVEGLSEATTSVRQRAVRTPGINGGERPSACS